MTKTMFGVNMRRSMVMARAIAVSALLVATAAACGESTEPATKASPTASATAATAAITVRDPWVKAADTGMTAAFGTLVNDSGTEVVVVGATSAVSPMELHEMAMVDGKMVMRQKAGGLTIPAGGTHALEPGGDHLMLMNLSKPIKPGDEVTITLTLSDGRSVEFTAIAKPFTGANESYAPGHAPATTGSGH